MSAIQVRSAGQPDEQAVIDVITLAFSTDPMARWTSNRRHARRCSRRQRSTLRTWLPRWNGYWRSTTAF